MGEGMQLKCVNCNSTNDVLGFYAGEEYIALCVKCREKLALGQLGKIGRPSMGVTKKVSITLPNEDWNWLDEQAEGNRSKFLRYLIGQEQTKTDAWNNDACLGYVISGAKRLGYTEDQ